MVLQCSPVIVLLLTLFPTGLLLWQMYCWFAKWFTILFNLFNTLVLHVFIHAIGWLKVHSCVHLLAMILGILELVLMCLSMLLDCSRTCSMILFIHEVVQSCCSYVDACCCTCVHPCYWPNHPWTAVVPWYGYHIPWCYDIPVAFSSLPHCPLFILWPEYSTNEETYMEAKGNTRLVVANDDEFRSEVAGSRNVLFEAEVLRSLCTIDVSWHNIFQSKP